MLEGRWVAIPPEGGDEWAMDRWVEVDCPSERVALLPTDTEAHKHWWEWVPFEPNQIPVLDGNIVTGVRFRDDSEATWERNR